MRACACLLHVLANQKALEKACRVGALPKAVHRGTGFFRCPLSPRSHQMVRQCNTQKKNRDKDKCL